MKPPDFLTLSTAVAITANRQRIVSGSADKTLRLWDLPTGQARHTLNAHETGLTTVAVTPDGRWVLSGSDDTMLKVWDGETGQLVHTLEGHAQAIRAVAVTPDGRLGVSGSLDATLKVWDLATGQEVRTLQGHDCPVPVSRLHVAPGGRQVLAACGGAGHAVRIWNIETGTLLHTLEWDTATTLGEFMYHYFWINAVAVLGDGQRVIVAYGGDNQRSVLVVWDMLTGTPLRAFQGRPSMIWAVAVTVDGRVALSGSEDGTLTVWSTETDLQHGRCDETQQEDTMSYNRSLT